MDTGQWFFSSPGCGQTFSLLNHRASLLRLQIIARSMKGPGGEEKQRETVTFERLLKVVKIADMVAK